MLDEANQQIKQGADKNAVAMDVTNKFAQQLANPETLESLRNLAAAGNTGAETVLQWSSTLKPYTMAEVEASKKAVQRQSVFTAFFASFESVFEGIKGAFLDSFLRPFLAANNQLDPDKVKHFWDTVKSLEVPASRLGAAMGNMVQHVFTPANIALMLNFVEGTAKILMAASSVVTWIVSVFGKTLQFVNNTFSKINKTVGGVATGLTAFAAFIAGRKLLGMLTRAVFGGVRDVITVKGKIINIEGAGGKGGGGSGPANDNKEQSPRAKAAADKRRANALKRGARRGLVGEELESYATKHSQGMFARARGFTGRQMMRLPGASRVAGLGGRVGGMAESALSHPLGRLAMGDVSGAATGAAERYGSSLGKLAPALGFAGKAIGVGGVAIGLGIAAKGAWDAIQDINARVKANKLSPQEGQAAIKKIMSSKAGQALGSVGGAAVGAALGTALIPIPIVGTLIGSAVGGYVGGKAGEMLGGALGNAIAGPDPKHPKTAAPKGQAPAGKAKGPEVINDQRMIDANTGAMLGNKAMIDELKKINDKLALHTAVLASTQQQQLDAQGRANNNMKNYAAAGT